MKNVKSIQSLFCYPGFATHSMLKGVFGDRYCRMITLRRRKKRPSVPAVGIDVNPDMIVKRYEYVTSLSLVGAFIWNSSVGELSAPCVHRCT